MRVCFYHAGCPDGFGAAWAVYRAWGDEGTRYLPRGHDDSIEVESLRGAEVAFVDIAPSNAEVRALAERAGRLIVLDHHVSSRDRFAAEAQLGALVARYGHHVLFDLEHSGAVLSWQHFHPGRPAPALLDYVEDQDLWRWKLLRSREVNAAIGSYPLRFEVWDRLAAADPLQLADEGKAIVRAQDVEVERALQGAHRVTLGGQPVEAVNATGLRALIGHELATRARFGVPYGLVYRVQGDRVDVSIYSVEDYDVAAIAADRGGGGHRSAAGFSVSMVEWLDQYLL